MSVEIFDCAQGTPEWFACRMGIATASEFDTVMAKGKGGAPSVTRRTYMLKLIGERMTGKPMYRYTNDHMERGHEMEDEARQLYAMVADVEPVKVGFIRREAPGFECGASPDSLIGDSGLLEIKTKLPHLQLEVLLAGRVPSEHMAQIQGQLWVSGREWLDFVSYWPGLPLFRKRVHRDQVYIERIASAVRDFNAELEATMAKVAA
jgi:predicted phage-related endonuclease